MTPLLVHGVIQAATAAEAITNAEVTVLCVSSYAAAHEIIEHTKRSTELSGAVFVNLTTGTPEDARHCRDTIQALGADYLDGAIIAYPQDIGLPETMVLYSGAVDMWAKNAATLCLLGAASYHLGDEIGGANALDAAMSGAFYCVALGGFVEGAGYAAAEQVAPELLIPAFDVLVTLLARTARQVVEAIRTGHHESDQATLYAYEEGCRHWRDALLEGGQHASLITALVGSLHRATAAGHGDLGISAQIKTSGLAATAGPSEPGGKV